MVTISPTRSLKFLESSPRDLQGEGLQREETMKNKATAKCIISMSTRAKFSKGFTMSTNFDCRNRLPGVIKSLPFKRFFPAPHQNQKTKAKWIYSARLFLTCFHKKFEIAGEKTRDFWSGVPHFCLRFWRGAGSRFLEIVLITPGITFWG